MTPVLSDPTESMPGEPGGRTCYDCRDPIEPGAHAYREIYGAVERTTPDGIAFGTTGGIVYRHWCDDCYQHERMRETAAHYDVTSGDRLWNILAAANGDLVADMVPMLIGGRMWFRIVDDELEARNAIREPTDEGIRFTTEPFDMSIGDFARYFDDPTDRTRVLLKTPDETPFGREEDP